MFLRGLLIQGGVILSKIEEQELNNIIGGGDTVTGTILNAFTNIIKILYDAGEGLGSSIRRISEGNLCPLE